MPSKFNFTDLRNIAKRIADGETLTAVANDLGVHADNLSKRIKAAGIELKFGAKWIPHNIIEIPKEPLVSMYKSNWSINRLATHFGVSRNVVERNLKQYCVKLRTQSEAETIKWSLMTPEQRANQVKPAHCATKGRIKSPEVKHRMAIARFKKPSSYHIGVGEKEFKKYIRGLNLVEDVNFQTVCDFYNIDVTIGTVAVELSPDASRFAKKAYIERIKHLINSYSVCIAITFKSKSAFIGNFDNIIADINFIRRNFTADSRYWMIRCREQNCTVVHDNLGQFSSVPTPVKHFTVIKTINIC